MGKGVPCNIERLKLINPIFTELDFQHYCTLGGAPVVNLLGNIRSRNTTKFSCMPDLIVLCKYSVTNPKTSEHLCGNEKHVPFLKQAP